MNPVKSVIKFLHRYDETHNFTCDVCGREVFGGERVCEHCMRALPFNDGAICPLCGRRVKEAGVCLECKRRPPAVDRARSAFVHEGEAARLVVRFKRGEKYLARTLAELALPCFVREFSAFDALVFVPMTERARRKRGYNQSRLFAEEIGARVGSPVLAAAVKRRETKMQKALGRDARENNLKGCFRAAGDVKGLRLVLIDDTYTTGATVGELAAVLRRAGAQSVEAFTFTGVEDKHPFGKREE